MSPKQGSSAPADFGMIGLGVMGTSLALNVEEHGFSVAVWNLEPERVDQFLSENTGKKIVGTKTFEEFVAALARPRRIMMMIKAGKPVDQVITRIKPLLEDGDILIDGGNSWFKDTQRREAALAAEGLNFSGCGVSGGEDGARYGASLMPGGKRETYEQMQQIFEAVAAKTESGPCVTWVGPDGAGHFVKMVHNGIEYGAMQLIAEAYDLLRRVGGLKAEELADLFAEWNRGPLESYLIEVTSQIFRVRDEDTGRPLVDLVVDKAGQKGTGKWAAQVALDLGVPVPTISAAIDARFLSSMKEERVRASSRLRGNPLAIPRSDRGKWTTAVHDALIASTICVFAQGMHLIRIGSDEWKWNIALREIARIWKGGCIIRARFLDTMMNAYERDLRLSNLLLDGDVATIVAGAERSWREVISLALSAGIPVPAMSASLGYYDSYRTASLPQNLTQAQRDYFGAHTYERVDRPGAVHTDWKSSARS